MLESFRGHDKISIISFWRRDDIARDFFCYHYFYIQNLFVRDDKRSLFESEEKLVFLLYKKSEADAKYNLAILNL